MAQTSAGAHQRRNLRWANLTQVFANQANLAEAHLRGADLDEGRLQRRDPERTSLPPDAKLPEAFMPRGRTSTAPI